jgi:hypothetical protein
MVFASMSVQVVHPAKRLITLRYHAFQPRSMNTPLVSFQVARSIGTRETFVASLANSDLQGSHLAPLRDVYSEASFRAHFAT